MIEEVGVVRESLPAGGNLRLKIAAAQVLEGLKTGDSVSVNGICLTVTSLEHESFRAEVSEHTQRTTTVKHWQVGRRVNLERALRVGDRLGGHIVQGHIDGTGRVARVHYGSGSNLISIDLPTSLLRLLAPKGSVAVDGVSLTLTDKSARGFSVMVIPHTLENTTLGDLRPGDEVNIETDLIIRWLAERFPDDEIVAAPDRELPFAGEFHLED